MSGVIVLIAPLVAFLAIAWVSLIVAAPLLPAAPAGILYALGSRICHQISERSFHLGVAQLPVCARCLGIYAGFAIGLGIAISATVSRGVQGSPTPTRTNRALGAPGSDPATTHHRGLPPQRAQTARWGPRGLTPRMVVTIGALPTVITVIMEWVGLWHTSNLARAIAGAPLGVAVALLVMAGLARSARLESCAR